MKKYVRCINNDDYKDYLTLGQIYEVEEESVEYYRISNDNGSVSRWYKHRFEVVSQPIFTKEEIDTIVKSLCLLIDTSGEKITQALNDKEYGLAKSLIDSVANAEHILINIE